MHRFLIPFLYVATITTLSARLWTDNKGRTIEAEISSATESNVTVLIQKKPVVIPLDNLSVEDRQFVEDWQKNSSSTTPAPAEVTFNKQPVVTGGPVNRFTFEYTAAAQLMIKKTNETDSAYTIYMSVPKDFDPTKPQNVFFCSAAYNSKEDMKAGEFKVFGNYSDTCIKNNWVCITIDSNNGMTVHQQDIICGIAELRKQWPASAKWNYAFGGFSGGSKACMTPASLFLKEHYSVCGIFLAGCNEDRTSASYNVKNNDASRKKTKVFLSTGKTDGYVKPENNERVLKSLKGGGYADIRNEFFEGGHFLNRSHFEQALIWFTQNRL